MLSYGQWHWVPSAPSGNLKADQPNTIWIHGCPTEPGYYPSEDANGYQAEYVPEADDFLYLGRDIFANHGQLKVPGIGKTALAAIVPWPSPEFMGSEDRHWFIRTWTPSEVQAGHFHLPMFFLLEECTIRDIALSRRARQHDT